MKAYPRTANKYGGSRAKSAMGMVIPPFFGGSRVRISKIAMINRPRLRPALARTPLWKPVDPWKSLLSMMGWMTAPDRMNSRLDNVVRANLVELTKGGTR